MKFVLSRVISLQLLVTQSFQSLLLQCFQGTFKIAQIDHAVSDNLPRELRVPDVRTATGAENVRVCVGPGSSPLGGGDSVNYPENILKLHIETGAF